MREGGVGVVWVLSVGVFLHAKSYFLCENRGNSLSSYGIYFEWVSKKELSLKLSEKWMMLSLQDISYIKCCVWQVSPRSSDSPLHFNYSNQKSLVTLLLLTLAGFYLNSLGSLYTWMHVYVLIPSALPSLCMELTWTGYIFCFNFHFFSDSSGFLRFTSLYLVSISSSLVRFGIFTGVFRYYWWHSCTIVLL